METAVWRQEPAVCSKTLFQLPGLDFYENSSGREYKHVKHRDEFPMHIRNKRPENCLEKKKEVCFVIVFCLCIVSL